MQLSKFNKRFELFFLLFILVLGFIVRLYRFNGPIADWHSWRQADTSAVSRNFVTQGFDLLHPKFDDLSNVASGLDNPKGYRFVEFPIYNLFQAGLFKTVGILTLEEWGRLVSIFASLFAAYFLYAIVKKWSNKYLGLLSSFFYLFIPFNIYYSRTILPDTSMVMTVLGGIYFFDKWVSENSTKKYLYFLLALIFTSSSFLLKPYALFFVLPMLIIAFEKWKFAIFKKWPLYVFAFTSLVPLILWRMWIVNYPQGIPASAWLFNGNGIRFRPAFFRWIFYERLTKLISGYLGVVIPIFGILNIKKIKNWLFFLSFALSSLIYVCVFATGNVQHDYYQILIMPTVAIFFAIGTYYLYLFKFNKLPIGKIILAVSLVSLFVLGWNQVKDYFNINNQSIISAGAAVDRLTPKDAKVIANYNGDTSFLYQTKRKGWASFEKSLPQMTEMGASFLALVNPTAADLNLGNTYKIVEKTNQYVIFNLSKTK